LKQLCIVAQPTGSWKEEEETTDVAAEASKFSGEKAE